MELEHASSRGAGDGTPAAAAASAAEPPAPASEASARWDGSAQQVVLAIEFMSDAGSKVSSWPGRPAGVAPTAPSACRLPSRAAVPAPPSQRHTHWSAPVHVDHSACCPQALLYLFRALLLAATGLMVWETVEKFTQESEASFGQCCHTILACGRELLCMVLLLHAAAAA